MQYYIPTQDVLGTLSDVFTKSNYKFDDSQNSETFQKLSSTYQARLQENDFKSKLDRYLEKAKLRKKDENNLSISIQAAEKVNFVSCQTTCSREGDSYRLIHGTHDQEQQTNEEILQTKSELLKQEHRPVIQQIDSETQHDIKYQEEECQIEEIALTEHLRFKESFQFHQLNTSSVQTDLTLLRVLQQHEECQTINIEMAIDEKQDISTQVSFEKNQDQIESCNLRSRRLIVNSEKFQKCQCVLNQIVATDLQCQYDVSQTTDDNNGQLIEPRKLDLETELQFRNELIIQLKQQIEDLQKQLVNEKQQPQIERIKQQSNNESDYSLIVEKLNQQVKDQDVINNQLTQQILISNQEQIEFKKQLNETMNENLQLRNNKAELIGIIATLQAQLKTKNLETVETFQFHQSNDFGVQANLNFKKQDQECQTISIPRVTEQNDISTQVAFEVNAPQIESCCQSHQSSELLENLLVVNNEEPQKCQCDRQLHKIVTADFECQFDLNVANKLTSFTDCQFENLIRTRSRCQSYTNQVSNKKLSEPDEFNLEEELQLRDQLLEQKFLEIEQLQQQIEDLHKLLNEKQQSNPEEGNTDSSGESENSTIEQLNQQIKGHVEIQQQLTEQMLQSSQQLMEIKQQLDQSIDENVELRNERDNLIGLISKLKEQLIETEDSKSKEIDMINSDYRDKMSKQTMIIDELQQQISLSSSPSALYQMSMPQTMNYITQTQQKQVGSDSQLSRGSQQRTKEEKDMMLKSLKKMTTITAGLMSTKQDYTTLGALGRMDQVKSQQKLESYKRLN